MIEINTESKRIFFYHAPEEVKKNVKLDDTMHDFELLSGHICPECNKVIDAYYIGTLPIEEAGGTWNTHPYLKSKYGYTVYDSHYKYSHKYGGGYLIMCNHNDTSCKTHISSAGGIIEGIKSFIEYIIPTPEIVPSDYMIKKFAADILEHKIPGVSLIEDVCNQRAQLLAINKKEFAKHIEYNNLSEFDKEYDWKKMFYKLVMGDPAIKIIESEVKISKEEN